MIQLLETVLFKLLQTASTAFFYILYHTKQEDMERHMMSLEPKLLASTLSIRHKQCLLNIFTSI